VLDHVERGRILEQPAREDLLPGQRRIGIGAFLGKDLYEGPGLLRRFPRQGPLASREADDDIADPPRFARLDDNVLAKIVALVEQADGGNAVLDRGAVFAFDHTLGSRLCGNLLRNRGGGGLRIALPLASGKRKRGEAKQGKPAGHGQASGLQAS
jgi:hypothetical protein